MITYWYVMNGKLFHGSGSKNHWCIQDSIAKIIPTRTIYRSNFVLAFDHETKQLTLLKSRMGDFIDELFSKFIHRIIDSENMEIRIPTCLLDDYKLTPYLERKLLKTKLLSRQDIAEPSSIPNIKVDCGSIHVGWFITLLYLIHTDTVVTMDSFISVSLEELDVICEMNYETSRNFSMLESIWYITRTLYESP